LATCGATVVILLPVHADTEATAMEHYPQIVAVALFFGGIVWAVAWWHYRQRAAKLDRACDAIELLRQDLKERPTHGEIDVELERVMARVEKAANERAADGNRILTALEQLRRESREDSNLLRSEIAQVHRRVDSVIGPRGHA